jgi:hypothetical protein
MRVRGTIRYSNGAPAAGVDVVLFNRALRESQKIGQARTGTDGAYEIEAPHESSRTARKPKVNLFIEVTGTSKKSPSRSATLYDAAFDARIHHVLPADFSAAAEFDRLAKDVKALVGKHASIAGLQDSDDQEDVRFIAATLGEAEAHIVALVLAYRVERASKLPAAFVYALLRENVLTQGPLDRLHAVRFAVDLSVDPTTIATELALRDETVIRGAIDRAVRKRIVNAAIGKQLDGVMARLARERPAAVKADTEQGKAAVIDRIAAHLDPATIQNIKSVVSVDHIGNVPLLLDRINQAIAAAPAKPSSDTVNTLRMTGIFGADDTYLNGVRNTLKVDSSNEVVKLAGLDKAGWAEALRNAGEAKYYGRRELPDAAVEIESERLSRSFAQTYPTASFMLRLANHATTAPQEGALLQKVIAAQPDLDLATVNVTRFMSDSEVVKAETPENQETLRETLKGTQRLYRLTRDDATAAMLKKAGLGSAYNISLLGPKRLRAALDNRISEPEAAEIEKRARYIHTGALMLAGNIRTSVGSVDPYALQSDYKDWPQLKWKKDFPNLKTLFDVQDMCECLECRSVLGPAAYFVDVLQFLKKRMIKNTGGSSFANAKEALFVRRPDLGTIDLNCDNALTELPHIDIVNELLEALVAPPPQYPATADDLATLAAALAANKLPLGNNAMVTGPDSTGAKILRGDDGVYSVTGSAGAFKLTQLHQTHGSVEQRAAEPEYLNQNAYIALGKVNLFQALPFDLSFEEVSEVLQRFNIGRGRLMRALSVNPANAAAAAATAAADLSIPMSVANLIVTPDNANQIAYWSLQAGAKIDDFRTVSSFLDRTGMTFSDLEALIDLSFIDSTGALSLVSADDSCDLDQMTITGGDATLFDRIHRFLRLNKILGWPMDDLSRAIRYKNSGGDLDQAFLNRLAQITVLARRSGIKPGDVAALYGPGADGWSASRWASVFENPANKRKDPANDGLFHRGQLSGVVGAKLVEISTALGIKADQVSALAAIAPAASTLTEASLVRLHGLSVLNRASRLSTDEFVALVQFIRLAPATSGFDPVADPDSTLVLLDYASRLSAASLLPSRALALLGFDPTKLGIDQSEQTIAGVLQTLQQQLGAARKALDPQFDGKRPHAENRNGLAALLAQLPDLSSDDLARFDDLILDQWTQKKSPSDFLNAVLPALFDAPVVAAIVAAWNAVTATIPATRNDQLNSFIALLGQNASDYLYAHARQSITLQLVAAAFSVPSEIAAVILAKAHLKAEAAEAPRPLGDTLANDPSAPLPVGNAATEAARLLTAIINAIATLQLSASETDFLLSNAARLGLIELDAAPYKVADGPNGPLMRWLLLQKISKTYPATSDPASPGAVFGVLDLVAGASASNLSAVDDRLAVLTGWDRTVLVDLQSRFGITTTDALVDADNLNRFETAIALLQHLNVPVADGVSLAASVPGINEAALAAATLKAQTQPEDWLTVQKIIQDRLRAKRRDALIAYLTGADSRFASSQDLFDYLLVNVNMAPEEVTSRIVLAHGTLQVFAKRCLMGIESEIIADTDGDLGWDEWSWMANYRVWEAARQVFLYPENWLDPDLRDDQSELFQKFRSGLAQQELNDDNAQDQVEAYLGNLDDIAVLTPLACTYDSQRMTMHVFAATKGGDPTTYYYRRLIKERSWTPWQKIELDVTGEHLLAFMRNQRLYLAWAIFTQQEDKSQSTPMPDSATKPGTPVDNPPASKRLKMQLALSEYDGKSWKPKKLSQDPLWLCDSTTDPLPDPKDYRIIFTDLGTAGANVIVSYRPSGANPYDNYVGAFALTGCKGYPEPMSASPYAPKLNYLPQFVDTLAVANRPTEQDKDQTNDLSYLTAFAPDNPMLIFGNTPDGAQLTGNSDGNPGAFKITYPYQMTSLDISLILASLIFKK